MPTESFLKSYENVKTKNKLRALPYNKIQEVWSYCKRDWNNGRPPAPYIPFDEAEDFHKSLAKVRTLCSGKRGAKSTSAGMDTVPGITIPGYRCWIIGETYEICGYEFEYIEHSVMHTELWDKLIRPRIAQLIKKSGTYKKNPESYRKIGDRNGNKYLSIEYPGAGKSLIEMRSYGRDPEGRRMEGAAIDRAIFSEGNRVPKDMIDRHLMLRLRDRAGDIIIPTSPAGMDEFLHPAWQKGLAEELVVDIDYISRKVLPTYKPVEKSPYHIDNAEVYDESYETFHWPGYANPFYNIAGYKKDEELLFDGQLDEAAFLERNFGIFVQYAGSFFKGVEWDDVIVNSEKYSEDFLRTCTHFRAIDPGRASAFCCLYVALTPPDSEGNSQWIVYDEMYEKGLYVEKFCEMMLERDRFPIALSVADQQVTRQTMANEYTVQQRMIELGISPLTVPDKRPKTITSLNRWLPMLKKGQIKICGDKCKNFVREMQMLQYRPPKYSGGHSVKREELEESDMHAIDAFTYLYLIRPRFREVEQKLAPVIHVNSFEDVRRRHERNERRKRKGFFRHAIGTF